MHAKTVFAASLLALAQLAAASPPGCLLGAINTYDEPSDIKTLCGSKELSSTVQKYCGDSTSAAMDAIAEVCKEKGVDIDTGASPSATASILVNTTASQVFSTASAPYSTANASVSVNATASATGNVTISINATASATAPLSPPGTVPTVTGGPAGPGGVPNVTATAGVTASTGAAGRIEVGVAAILAGVMAIAL